MKFLRFAIILSIFLACDRSQERKYIPDIYVNFQLFPNSINYVAPGGWLIAEDEGFRGILVYRSDQYNFIAYEMACTYDPDISEAIVEVDSSTYTLIDSTCMSRYLMFDGSPIDGPSLWPLKRYQTNFDGTTLYITNTLN